MLIGKKPLLVLLFLKGHFNSHLRDAATVIRHTLGEIVLDSMTVKSNAEPNAGFSDDGLLLLVFEEFKNIRMLAVLMDTVIADIHFPKDILLRHALEIAVRTFAERADKREHIGVRNAHSRTTAPLGKTKQIPMYDRIFYIRIFYHAVVEKRNIGILRQGDFGDVQMCGDFDAAENADSVCVFFLHESDVVIISMKSDGLVLIFYDIVRCAEGILSAESNAVVMIANAEKLNAALGGGFCDSFRAVLAAKRIIRMRMKILYHGKWCLLAMFFFDILTAAFVKCAFLCKNYNSFTIAQSAGTTAFSPLTRQMISLSSGLTSINARVPSEASHADEAMAGRMILRSESCLA